MKNICISILCVIAVFAAAVSTSLFVYADARTTP